jgi:hypothetical protein
MKRPAPAWPKPAGSQLKQALLNSGRFTASANT